MRWLDSITDLMDTSLRKLQEAWRIEEPGRLHIVRGVEKSWTRLSG